MSSIFWDDLQESLKDPEYLREYVTQSVRITTTDRLINALADQAEVQGMSRADIARSLNKEAGTIRRLFTHPEGNPTIGTLAEIAGVLGYRLELVRMDEHELAEVTIPLRDGAVPAHS